MNKLALLLALLLLLAGCGSDRPPAAEGEAYSVYFLTDTVESSALKSEVHRLSPSVAPAEGLLRALLSAPQTQALTSPIPAGTRLLAWGMDTDGTLNVDLSEQYGGLSGVDLTLADYCIALTLCQLPDVEAVSITVEGEPIAFRAHQRLKGSDVILSGSEDAPIYYSATLYFLREGGGLATERRDLLITETQSLSTALLAALMDGPTGEGLSFPLSADTELLSAYIDSEICYVNFSSHFVSQAPTSPLERNLLLYCVVNTLCTQTKVSSVHLFVDGSSIDSYGGIPTRTPLEPNPDLVVGP